MYPSWCVYRGYVPLLVYMQGIPTLVYALPHHPGYTNLPPAPVPDTRHADRVTD